MLKGLKDLISVFNKKFSNLNDKYFLTEIEHLKIILNNEIIKLF